MHFLKKLRQGLNILKLTGFRYFRASQLNNEAVTYNINNVRVVLEGQSVLSMLIGIVISDEYHLKKQHQPKTIIDVGANVGIFAIYAAALFPDCKIYALEPSLDNFQLLIKNTSSFSQIQCFNKGMSNYNGVAYISGDKDNTAFKTSAFPSLNTLEQCEVVTLDTFLASNSINHIDILKLDCEGAEYDIAQDNLCAVNQIVGEYHTVESKTPEQLKQYFLQQGFHLKQWSKSDSDIAGIFWLVNKRYN